MFNWNLTLNHETCLLIRRSRVSWFLLVAKSIEASPQLRAVKRLWRRRFVFNYLNYSVFALNGSASKNRSSHWNWKQLFFVKVSRLLYFHLNKTPKVRSLTENWWFSVRYELTNLSKLWAREVNILNARSNFELRRNFSRWLLCHTAALANSRNTLSMGIYSMRVDEISYTQPHAYMCSNWEKESCLKLNIGVRDWVMNERDALQQLQWPPVIWLFCCASRHCFAVHKEERQLDTN